MGALPVWWGRTDWVQVEVRGIVREAVDVCRDHHVAPDTVIKVAAAHAEFADSLTGRNCRPTNERMVEVARCSLSTVQRARRVLMELGLMVEVVAGRSNMTLAQRLVAHENGSSHRAIAAEFVLCSRRDRRPRLVENPAADLQVVDRDTPPVGKVVRTSAREISGHLQSETATRKAAPRPAHTERVDQQAARRLAERVQRRLEWLRGVHVGRLVFLLTPFAQAGWTDEDVCLAVRDRLAILGKRVPAKLERPWAYLAWLLRGVDVDDRPSVLEDAHAAAERAHRLLVTRGAPCEHGVPGGDVVSPADGAARLPAVPRGLEGRRVGVGADRRAARVDPLHPRAGAGHHAGDDLAAVPAGVLVFREAVSAPPAAHRLEVEQLLV
jgi:hypothetical protein